MTLSNLDKKMMTNGFTIKIEDNSTEDMGSTLPIFYAKTGDDMAAYLNDWPSRLFHVTFMVREEEYDIST